MKNKISVILLMSILMCLCAGVTLADDYQFTKGEKFTSESFIFYEGTDGEHIAKVETVEIVLDAFYYNLPKEISKEDAKLLWIGGNINRDDCEILFISFTNDLVFERSCQNIIAKHNPQKDDPYSIEVMKRPFKEVGGGFYKGLVIVLIGSIVLMGIIFFCYQVSIRIICDYARSMLFPMINIIGLNLFLVVVYTVINWLGGSAVEIGLYIIYGIFVLVCILKPLFDSSFDDVIFDLEDEHECDIRDTVLWILMNFMAFMLAGITELILYDILLEKMPVTIVIDWMFFIASWLGVSMILAVSLSQIFRKKEIA